MMTGRCALSDGATNGGEMPQRKLFQPFTIRGLTLKNRLVVPPMVHYRAETGSTCGTFHVVHLGRYALGGFGLVWVEATGVEAVGLINEHDLGIWNDAQVESFKPLIAFMKRQGCAIGIQLAHGGRKSSSQTAMQGMGPLTEENLKAGAKKWQPVGPTAEPVAKGWLTPRQLTTAECKAMVGTWANAARNAVKAGFDTVEIHTAHGYLLGAFFFPGLPPPPPTTKRGGGAGARGTKHPQRRVGGRPRRSNAPAARNCRGRAQGDAVGHAAVRARLLGRRHAGGVEHGRHGRLCGRIERARRRRAR